MLQQKKIYGWRPDKPDQRDFKFKAMMRPAALPKKVDLTPQMPPVYDQADLGSCTANAAAAAVEYLAMKVKKDFMPSRLFIYYGEREIENTINEDAGAEIRDGIKTLHEKGVCDENLWQYVVSSFANQPSEAAYAAAKPNIVTRYERVDSSKIHNIKAALAAGYPVIFGFTVYESFESEKVATTGKVPMPKANEKMMGGHAVLCVGYNDSPGRFIVRNSWSEAWGMKGYCTMPYNYLSNLNLADDFWIIKQVGLG